jgi:hypothetical protein
MLETYSLAGRTVPVKTQEVKRVEPGLAPLGSKPSIYEAAHADVHHRTERQERKQHRRTAVTH